MLRSEGITYKSYNMRAYAISVLTEILETEATIERLNLSLKLT